jgi:hypothetical protein
MELSEMDGFTSKGYALPRRVWLKNLSLHEAVLFEFLFVIGSFKLQASAKRFSVTGSGKITRRQAGRAHLLRKKTTKRKNRLSGKV